MKVLEERDVAHVGDKTCHLPARTTSRTRRRFTQSLLRLQPLNGMISAEDQPFEQSPDGLIKHLVHEKMGTREHCVDAYMLFLKEGERSGKHRHMWEEVVFVAEGSGYDLHWDLKFDCIDAYQWDWETEPLARKSRMDAGRFHLRPTLHDPSAFQHEQGRD